MNYPTLLALATMNDWRAIEAGAHAFAARLIAEDDVRAGRARELVAELGE